MRRIKKLIVMLAAVTGIMLITPILPAMAEEEAAGSTVFFPYGNGATYSCGGGASFVFDAAGTGNCTVEQIGALPADLVCEVPATITFMHHGHQWVADARLCQ